MSTTLKELRKARDLTQAELALQINCTQGTISGFERGRVRESKPATVRKLAAALHTDQDTIKEALALEVRRRRERNRRRLYARAQ